jgi:H+/Cl- antiporter ClcA
MNAWLPIFRHHRLLWLSGRRWRMRLVLWGIAIAVGMIGVAFARAANRAQEGVKMKSGKVTSSLRRHATSVPEH